MNIKTIVLQQAIKYRKTIINDRDAIPKEDLFFSITLFPLATLEQKIDKKLYRDDNNVTLFGNKIILKLYFQ